MTFLTHGAIGNKGSAVDLVCFSHLRWNFVYQRPQHLLSRFAAEGRVFYIEEPIFGSESSHLAHAQASGGVHVVVPHIFTGDDPLKSLRHLIDDFFIKQEIDSYSLWFYTPMHLPWTRHLKPLAVVYDCMDELSGFKGAPPEMREREVELMRWADVVFTGGQSLYEAKCGRHKNIYAFPSSIDAPHFARARTITSEPEDQASIPGLRVGFFGVVDERMDLELIATIAQMRPEWHLVIIGPVVKINASSLPQAPNIHYLGMKTYDELPAYISGWDLAILPFAMNDATRFISPTKTPEYLAAGLPVVSTPIRDVIFPYGDLGVVHIAGNPEDFVAAAERALAEDAGQRLRRVDALLSQTSWSRTWGRMAELLNDVVERRQARQGFAADLPRPAAAAAGGAD